MLIFDVTVTNLGLQHSESFIPKKTTEQNWMRIIIEIQNREEKIEEGKNNLYFFVQIEYYTFPSNIFGEMLPSLIDTIVKQFQIQMREVFTSSYICDFTLPQYGNMGNSIEILVHQSTAQTAQKSPSFYRNFLSSSLQF